MTADGWFLPLSPFNHVDMLFMCASGVSGGA